jgi:cytochrome c oxidase assembly factor CtaG
LEIVEAERAMTVPPRSVFGINIPSDSPLFLTVLGFHVLAALIAVVTGAIAMLSAKRAGRRPRFGKLYYWCLSFVFLTATILAGMRWSEDAYLFFLGAASFSAAILGRAARRRRWQGWVRIHISGMGLSYTLMLIAFYMDNGKQLPVWKHFPSVTYWLLPTAVGVPLIVRALLRYRRIDAET